MSDPQILQRELTDQLVLSRLHRGVHQEALPDLLQRGLGELTGAAEHCGGTDGPPFVVFHDPGYRPEDITVEVCVPVRRPPQSAIGDGVRTEPAHRELYVRLTRAQSAPDAIGRWYEAVATEVRERGLTVAAGPREIYFADVLGAGPDDEVCDLAYPVGASGREE